MKPPEQPDNLNKSYTQYYNPNGKYNRNIYIEKQLAVHKYILYIFIYTLQMVYYTFNTSICHISTKK